MYCVIIVTYIVCTLDIDTLFLTAIILNFFLFPRFFSYSCLSRPSGRWLAQATVREKSWKEEKIQNYGDKEQCSISSVPLGNSISYFYFFNRAMEKLEKITNYPILIVNEEIYTVHIFNFHKFKTYTWSGPPLNIFIYRIIRNNSRRRIRAALLIVAAAVDFRYPLGIFWQINMQFNLLNPMLRFWALIWHPWCLSTCLG